MCKAILLVIKQFISVSKPLFYALFFDAETGTPQRTFLLCQWLFGGMLEGDGKAGRERRAWLLPICLLVLSLSPQQLCVTSVAVIFHISRISHSAVQAPVGQHPRPRGLDPSRQGSLPQASRFCPHPLTFVSTTLGTVAASQSYCLSGAPASPLYLFGSPILRFEFPLLNYFLLKQLVCFLTNTHRSSKIQTQVYLTPSPVP